jgi:hypothetical protein
LTAVRQECVFHLSLGQTFQTLPTGQAGLSEELSSFLYRYNYERRHVGLNYTPPLDRLRRVTELVKWSTEEKRFG